MKSGLVNKKSAAKEIYQLWFSITNDCNNRCVYCFVKKTPDCMSEQTVVKAFDLLLDSPGENKKIIIFGGEPTLKLDLLRKIVSLSQQKAKSLGKNIEFSLGTNAVALNQTHIDFFKTNNFQLSITLDGAKETHDKYRILKDGKPTYDDVVRNLARLQAVIPAERISILFGIYFSEAENMFNNFKHLVIDLKVESVNIEPIQNHEWTAEETTLFTAGLKNILRQLLQNINARDFFYINSLNRILEMKLATGKREYPFYKNLVVFSDGQITVNPFLYYIDTKYIVGNVLDGVKENCAQCDGKELKRKIVDCKIIEIRNHYCEKIADYLIQQARSKPLFAEYIQGALKRIFE